MERNRNRTIGNVEFDSGHKKRDDLGTFVCTKDVPYFSKVPKRIEYVLVGDLLRIKFRLPVSSFP